MVGSLLLVHSPLVGPSSLRRLAEGARFRGHEVFLPDLTSVATADSPRWEAYASRAVASVGDLSVPIAVVGHSGAGAFLPAIGEAVNDLAALIFVDAAVPACAGVHQTDDRMRELLDNQTSDGLLLPWLDWWPTEDVADLLPDSADRELLATDMPRLPRSFYDDDVSLPTGWSQWHCGYLRLSSAYEAEFEEARVRGWRRTSIDGTHLSVHTHPEAVLDAIEGLLETTGV